MILYYYNIFIIMHVHVHVHVHIPLLHHHRNGAVRFESVMRLRSKLEELGKMEGIKTAEKGQDMCV